MKDRHIVVVALVLVAVMMFFYFKGKKPVKAEVETSVTETEEKPVILQKYEPVVQTIPVSGTGETAPVSTTAAAPALNENILKNFARHMVEVQKCLHLNSVNVGEQMDPRTDNLMSLLRPTLGEAIVQIDDWSQFDLTDKTGTKKRYRVDYDYPDGVTPNRRLSSYTLNSYGALEIDNLTSDQTDNPNEAYIESLKEGTHVLSEERAARVYYSQGEELAFTMKNGKLDTFNITRSEYSINCSGLTEENSRCTCQ
jgi:flagellar basal body-associated protein FliL